MIDYDRDFMLKALLSLKHARRYKKNIFEREIKPFLGNRIMEVGAGIGIFAEHILSCNPDLFVITDIDEFFLKILSEKFKHPNVIIRKLDINSENSVDNEITSLKIDTLIANHVIEHTDDSVSLANLSKILAPGGLLILRVPAFNFFYNKIDKRFGHIKRYTKREMCEKLERNGFDILISSYKDAFKLIPWIIFGFSNITSDILFSRRFIKFMDMIYGSLSFIFDLPLAIGANVYCVGRKRTSTLEKKKPQQRMIRFSHPANHHSNESISERV